MSYQQAGGYTHNYSRVNPFSMGETYQYSETGDGIALDRSSSRSSLPSLLQNKWAVGGALAFLFFITFHSHGSSSTLSKSTIAAAAASSAVNKTSNATGMASSTTSNATGPRCDEILLGPWVKTCFLLSAGKDSLFDGQQGHITYPIIITQSSKGGFDLHGFASQDPFFGGAHFYEMGHGSLSRVATPSAHQHCVAAWESLLKVGNGKFVEHNGDYYWNQVAQGRLMAGNGPATCYFRRLVDPIECREARAMMVKQFLSIDIEIDLPEEDELCG